MTTAEEEVGLFLHLERIERDESNQVAKLIRKFADAAKGK